MKLPPVEFRLLFAGAGRLEVKNSVGAVVMLHDDIESPLDVTGASGARDCDAIRSDLLLAVSHDPWRERRTEVLRSLAGVIIFLEPSDRGENCGKRSEEHTSELQSR